MPGDIQVRQLALQAQLLHSKGALAGIQPPHAMMQAATHRRQRTADTTELQLLAQPGYVPGVIFQGQTHVYIMHPTAKPWR